jgi:ribosomal protein S18 acetylase RimI-like enzyme
MNITNQQASILPEQFEKISFDYLTFLASLPKFEKNIQADVTMISTDAPVFYFNAAFNARFNGNVEQSVKITKDFFSKRGRAFVWQVTPSSQPENLGELLIGQGGQFLESMPFMALQLDNMQRDFPVPLTFHYETVRNHEMLSTWTSIYGDARAYPKSDTRLFSIFSDLDLRESSPLQLILGYLGNTPAATYSVFMGRKVAGLYSLSTLPEARGHGLGTAMSIVAVDLAKEYGYESAILLSEPPSRNICKRLGFVDGFGNLDIYRISV